MLQIASLFENLSHTSKNIPCSFESRFPKYIADFNLFDLQLVDINFRKLITFQSLVFLDSLNIFPADNENFVENVRTIYIKLIVLTGISGIFVCF